MYKTLLSQRTAAEKTRRSFIDPLLLLLHISSCWHSCRLQMKTILFLVVVFFFLLLFFYGTPAAVTYEYHLRKRLFFFFFRLMIFSQHPSLESLKNRVWCVPLLLLYIMYTYTLTCVSVHVYFFFLSAQLRFPFFLRFYLFSCHFVFIDRIQ
jgi:hypothetical protein